ncbi:hypothetical protein HAX54_033593 [Datura stramonium]|uniref:Uncharacterized protein n=1 Tax=Datura stramonium TaxID=4076 RepID=A0ABS8VFI6_DATST|nr:hypothetical protein [Datura stramonium]
MLRPIRKRQNRVKVKFKEKDYVSKILNEVLEEQGKDTVENKAEVRLREVYGGIGAIVSFNTNMPCDFLDVAVSNGFLDSYAKSSFGMDHGGSASELGQVPFP